MSFKTDTQAVMEYPNRLKELRKAKKLSQEKLAALVNTSKGQIYNLERGNREMTIGWMTRLAVPLEVNPEDLISDSKAKLVPVVGLVEAGIITVIEGHSKGAGLEFVESPRRYNDHQLVAVRVKGDSMRPAMRDGLLLFYNLEFDGVPEECIGEQCVVKTQMGGYLIRDVKAGSRANYFHLIAYNGETSFDVQLDWAAKIIDMRPR